MSWRIEHTPGSRVHHTADGRMAVPLQLSHNGEHPTDAELVLSLIDAERLHASLFRPLDGHPPPADALEDCREAVEAPHALSAKVAEANRRSREAL